jgi:acyl carrier protein
VTETLDVDVREVVGGVKEILRQELGDVPIHLRSHMENDLQADSLAAVQLVMEAEDRFEIKIEDDEAKELETVKDLVKLILVKKGVPVADAEASVAEAEAEEPVDNGAEEAQSAPADAETEEVPAAS